MSEDPDQWEGRQSASFRGVPFYLEKIKGKSGRRALPHEYPKRDAGWTEDHGGVLNNETINALLVGPDAESDFLALLAALNVAGSGELVHPYWGIQQVQIGNVDYELDNNERHKATLSFPIYAAGENLFPAEAENTADVIDELSDAANDASNGNFADWVSNLSLDDLATLNDTINDMLDDLDGFVYGLPGIPSAISDWVGTLDRLKGSVGRLLAYPGELARDITNMIINIKDLVTTLPAALNVYDKVISKWEGLAAEYSVDANNDIKTANDNAVKEGAYNSFIGTAVVGKGQAIASAPDATDTADEEESIATSIATSTETGTDTPTTGLENGFSDSEQALDAGKVLIGQLTNLAEDAVDSGNRVGWRTYRSLRIAINNDIAVRVQQLPSVTTIVPVRTMPVALLAYQQTGDTKNRSRIVSRNRMSRPSFLTTEMSIEVISAGVKL